MGIQSSPYDSPCLCVSVPSNPPCISSKSTRRTAPTPCASSPLKLRENCALHFTVPHLLFSCVIPLLSFALCSRYPYLFNHHLLWQCLCSPPAKFFISRNSTHASRLTSKLVPSMKPFLVLPHTDLCFLWTPVGFFVTFSTFWLSTGLHSMYVLLSFLSLAPKNLELLSSQSLHPHSPPGYCA